MIKSSPLRIIFCGTPDFAIPTLQTLALDSRFIIDLVITQPDRPIGRKRILSSPPVKIIAEKLGLTVKQPERLNSALPQIQTYVPRPDFLIVAAYGQILNQDVLNWPSKMPINIHASLLPRWRGASPIEAALIAGDRETGITIQRMVKALDAGDILAQRAHPISDTDTSQTLRHHLAELGAHLLIETLTQPFKPVAQDTSRITLCSLLSRHDGLIDSLHFTAAEIERRWRALTPWPGLTMNIQGEMLKIKKISLIEQPQSIPLSCAKKTTIWITEVQPVSGVIMSAAAWLRGHKKTPAIRQGIKIN